MPACSSRVVYALFGMADAKSGAKVLNWEDTIEKGVRVVDFDLLQLGAKSHH